MHFLFYGTEDMYSSPMKVSFTIWAALTSFTTKNGVSLPCASLPVCQESSIVTFKYWLYEMLAFLVYLLLGLI